MGHPILLVALLAAQKFDVIPAEPDHLEPLVALVNEAYDPAHPITLKDLKSNYFHPNTKLLVLIDKTKKTVAGVLAVDYSPKKGAQATVDLFAVKKEYRGKNLSHLLLQAAEHYVRRLGKTELAVSVYKQNTQLIAYWEQLGYKKTEGKFFFDLQKTIN